MKKFGRYIIYLIILSVFVLVMSFVIHIQFDKINRIWLLYYVALDYLYYIPIITGLSILWPLVIKSKSEAEASFASSGTGFFIIVYIFSVMAGCVAFQELAVPGLYGIAKYQTELKEKNIRKAPPSNRTGKNFSMQEFYNLSALPAKENIAFAMGNSFVYFQKMVKSGFNYYGIGFRMIAYKENKQLDYILSSTYAKLTDGSILAVSPIYQQYSGGRLINSIQIKGVKSVPLIYEPDGIFALSSESTSKAASLIDIFLYNNYVFSSKINYFHLGNIVFNKVAYYITVILILILVSSFGAAFRSQRPLYRDYFQTVCFYIVSFVGIALVYDVLIAIVNMIYGLVI